MSAFVHPWLLLGLAGMALPIIIHILTRDRVRKVAFSTLRFFLQSARVTLRRKRWQEMVLIALRVLVCALAALVFARPLLGSRDGTAGRTFAHARMIVADVSASMARAGGAAALATEIRQAVSDLPSSAAVGLLACDQAVKQLVPLGDDLRAVSDAAAAVATGEGGTDLAAALRQADAALRTVQAGRKDIVLISDLPRAGLETYKGDWKLAPGVVLRPVVLAPAPTATDIGIADGQCPRSLVRDGQPRAITARLINRGSNDVAAATVVLRLGERDADRQTVHLPPGGSLSVRFWHVFDQPGDNPGEIVVLGDDADPADNRFFFNARVIPEIPILLAGPRPDATGGSIFFLRKALAPGPGTPFTLRVVDASALRPADIDATSVLVLADVGAADPDVVAATSRLLARGGGVLFLPGDDVAPEAFWTAWSAVAPCRLKRVLPRRSTQGVAEGEFGRLDLTHPVLEMFQRPHHGDFATVRLARYWDVSESQASRVLARYSDGRPAILERLVGEGVATIWLSPPDPTWNNLPQRAIFLPLLHETLRQAAVRTEWPTVFTVGETPAPPPGYAYRDADDLAALAAVPAGVLSTGFHALTNGEGRAVCYAVNRPFAEADPLPLKPQELKAALERPDDADHAGVAGVPTAGKPGRELWWWLAAALALLLPFELWFANRTARH
jgi:hypothetical protein